jgi:hypothetical protein
MTEAWRGACIAYRRERRLGRGDYPGFIAAVAADGAACPDLSDAAACE